MPDTPASLAERMLDEGEKTLQFFRALALQDWNRVVYKSEEIEPVQASPSGDRSTEEIELGKAAPAEESQPSFWSLHDLLAHFTSSEASFTLLIQDILSGGGGAPEDFDIDRFNRSKVARLTSAPPEALMEEYAINRRRNAELVSGMHLEDLSLTGRHPFLGVAPLVDIIKLIYRHNAIHLRDVRKLLV